jgi:ribosomal protein S18 acetylase RimI-like enzyme
MSVETEEYLDAYLAPPGKAPGIGYERVKMPSKNQGRYEGIAKFTSPHGSYRYVCYVMGQPVGVLQVVSLDKRHAIIANVYTMPKYRNRHIASELLARARMDFMSVKHAKEEMLSTKGRAWREKIK